jgi:hypothetical protein
MESQMFTVQFADGTSLDFLGYDSEQQLREDLPTGEAAFGEAVLIRQIGR